MKIRNVIIAAIFLLIILPALLLPFILFISELFTAEDPGSAWDAAWTLLTGMSLMDQIGLHSAITGIIVIIGAPFVFQKIYRKEKEHRKLEEFNRRKQMLHEVLYNGIVKVMKSQQDEKSGSANYIQVTDNHINMISQVDSLFSEKQILFLRQALELLKEISKQAKSDSTGAKQSVESLVKLVTIPKYMEQQSTIQNENDIYKWLNEESTTILQLLSEEQGEREYDENYKRRAT